MNKYKDPQEDWTIEQERAHGRKLESLKTDIRLLIKAVLNGESEKVRLHYCGHMRDFTRKGLGALLTEHQKDDDSATSAQSTFDSEARVKYDNFIDDWIGAEAKETVEYLDEMGLLNERE